MTPARLKRLIPGYRQYDALLALRMNYTRRGVWHYLTHRVSPGVAAAYVSENAAMPRGEHGWRRVLFHPTRVAQQMHAFAEGAFS